MAEVKRYYQARLRKGDQVTTGWIEARGAKVGLQVQLLPDREFWTVEQVFENGMDEKMLREHQGMHRKSLPSVIGND